MADRSVVVRLRAITDEYTAAMQRAGQSTAGFRDGLVQTATDSGEALTTIGVAAAVGGGAIVAGLAVAVDAAMKFDASLSELGAVSDATSGQMDKLRQAALDAGAATVFSANDAAAAQAELAKAGISVSDILGGALTGTLDLAAAGGLDLADAATVAAQAMNIFGLAGSDVTTIADTLAAGANKSAADVASLGDALKQGGGVAAATGLSLQETVAALSAFADSALVGSDAGTSLKSMLQRLTPQSKEAATLMEELGFSAFDASGEFVGLEGLAGNLQTALAGMNTEQRASTLATLFGSDAVRAANVLYTQGAAGIKGYVNAVNDQGAAADLAAKKLDNLAGDIEALKGSLDTALIQSGSKATDTLRGIAQAATDVVNVYNGLPGPAQTATVATLGLVGGVSLLGGAALIAAPKVAALNAAILTTTRGAFGLRGAVSILGKTAGAVAGLYVLTIAADAATDSFNGLVGALPAAGRDAAKTLESIGRSGSIATKDLRELGAAAYDFDELVNRTFNASSGRKIGDFFSNVGSLGGHLPWGQDEVDELKRFFKSYDDGLNYLAQTGRIDEARKAFDTLAVSLDKQGVSREQALRELPTYAAYLDTSAAAASSASAATDALSESTLAASIEQAKLEEETRAATETLSGQADVIRAQYDPLFALNQALRDQRDAQEAVKKATAENGAASVEARDANFDLLSSAVGVTEAAKKLQEQFNAGTITIGQSDAQLASWVQQGLLTESQAALISTQISGLARSAYQLSNTPATVDVTAPNALAVQGTIAALDRQLDILSGRTVSVSVQLGVSNKLAALGFASGGVVPGAGSGDTVPAMLTPGEGIVTKSGMARLGSAGLAALNAAGRSVSASASMTSAGGGLDYGRLAMAVAAAMHGVTWTADGREIARAAAPHMAAAGARYERRG